MSSRAPQPLPYILPADEVIPAMRRIITDREAVRNSVASKVTPEEATFANVIQPWLEEEDANQETEAVIDMYRYGGPDQESRDAAEEATRLMSECTARLAMRHDLFLLVKAVADKDECPNEECRKAVRDILRGFTNMGLGSRSAELEGVPTEEIIRLAEDGKDGVFINFGKRADRLLVLRHARSPATRKKLYLGNEQKLSENVALFKTVVLLRDRNARLLRFKSHAEFKLQERIATSTEWVDDMLHSMREQLLPIGQEVMEQLKATKGTHLVRSNQSGDDEILPWDFHYYMRLLEEDKKVDHELISEYFPLRNTVLRMLELFESCLQLHFLPIAPDDLAGTTWHEDVEAWSVWDKRPGHTGEFIGYLFSDTPHRNGKYRGNQNVNLQASYVKPDGSRVFPATILMCNFSPSAVTGCALLKHSEVVTLFHELGHGIHDLLSRTFHTRYHAWRTPAEFAEALSTMLENWCWNKSELKEMSCHYTGVEPDCIERWKAQHPGISLPAEKIPEELLDQLIGSGDLNKALRLVQQTADSAFDMIIHNPTTREDLLQLDGTKLYSSIKEDYTLLRNPDPTTWGPAHCHFGHLMSGYDAGYFSYLSAQIFAADFYETAFATNPRSQQTWDRYRRLVLEPGGSRDGLKMMEDFLGHSPTPDDLVRALRLG
ncbi:hypothetical protein INS49_010540 [Diaporthe citri]|uniref:uncharacterized protein n=1 Tax=Diaporthe citri TaxID=83186 RepID=UPI001C821D1A|nr:uncharacterized protein INS49_010540 [Diaporthe citri]KAG6362310.1 hypothetical protein INS49_010540 [Diaporthe citri]